MATPLPTPDPIEPLPPCRYRDLPTTFRADGDWAITLLDPMFRLPASYVPPRMVPMSSAGPLSAERVRLEGHP